MTFVLAHHLLAEVFLEVLANDKDQLAETGVDGIINGVVHDCFTIGAQTVHLLQASITAAHTGSK